MTAGCLSPWFNISHIYEHAKKNIESERKNFFKKYILSRIRRNNNCALLLNVSLFEKCSPFSSFIRWSGRTVTKITIVFQIIFFPFFKRVCPKFKMIRLKIVLKNSTTRSMKKWLWYSILFCHPLSYILLQQLNQYYFDAFMDFFSIFHIIAFFVFWP